MATKPPVPARAFKSQMETNIHSAILDIAGRLFLMAKPRFTGDELLELFVDPSIHKTLRTAFQVAEGCGTSQQLFIDLQRCSNDRATALGQLYFMWTYGQTPDGFFVPRRHGGTAMTALLGARPEADEDLREKFYDMMEQVVRISYEWGLVLRTFKELNQPGFCATPHQLRYVWPSILPILKRIGTREAEGWVTELQHESPRAGDKARVPHEIQPHMRETYDIVTRSIVMLGDERPEDRAGPMRILLNTPKFETFSSLDIEGLA